MKESYRTYFEYNFEMNTRYIRFFESEKKEGDFHLKEMSHILKAHKLWLERINGVSITQDFWSIISFQEMKSLNSELLEITLDKIEIADLSQTIIYSNSKGVRFKNKIEDIFFHLINHSNYHRARAANYLREQNIIPPNSDFIYYVRESI
ncbi:MAG: hypothetical protein SCALA702_11070 [Melioribacteraceae bacterium]|nr:MAG: hypothetical protein SCALA702_11070 [Melioribacteraceae bacterium]